MTWWQNNFLLQEVHIKLAYFLSFCGFEIHKNVKTSTSLPNIWALFLAAEELLVFQACWNWMKLSLRYSVTSLLGPVWDLRIFNMLLWPRADPSLKAFLTEGKHWNARQRNTKQTAGNLKSCIHICDTSFLNILPFLAMQGSKLCRCHQNSVQCNKKCIWLHFCYDFDSD